MLNDSASGVGILPDFGGVKVRTIGGIFFIYFGADAGYFLQQ